MLLGTAKFIIVENKGNVIVRISLCVDILSGFL